MFSDDFGAFPAVHHDDWLPEILTSVRCVSMERRLVLLVVRLLSATPTSESDTQASLHEVLWFNHQG